MVKWWNDSNIDVVEVEGRYIALGGWNGDTFTDCWEVEKIIKGINVDTAFGIKEDNLRVRPLYYKDTDGDYRITAYEFD